jgi:hypothetical protein
MANQLDKEDFIRWLALCQGKTSRIGGIRRELGTPEASGPDRPAVPENFAHLSQLLRG